MELSYRKIGPLGGGVTKLSPRAYNILAAMLGIVTGVLTFLALLMSPGPALIIGLVAAFAAIACGIAWLIAAIKGP
jgi:hypothetical protein